MPRGGLVLTPTSPRGVALPSLYRSRLYLEALLNLDSIFGKGVASIIHDGPHHYYMCLLKLDQLGFLNELNDLSTIPDKQFKGYLEKRMLQSSTTPSVSRMHRTPWRS